MNMKKVVGSGMWVCFQLLVLSLFSLMAASPLQALIVDSDDAEVSAQFATGELVTLNIKAEAGEKMWIFLEAPALFPLYEFARPSDAYIQENQPSSYVALFSAEGTPLANADELFYAESQEGDRISFADQNLTGFGSSVIVTSKKGDSAGALETIQTITLSEAGGPVLSGEYTSVAYHSDVAGEAPAAALAGLSFDGAGNGSLVYMGTAPPPIPFTYSVNDDGVTAHSATLPDGTTAGGSGILASNGEVAAQADNDAADGVVGMEVGVKTSAGMSNASLSGDYVSVGYHGTPGGGIAGTALLELTFDGAGGGTVTYTGTAQEDFTTSLTYDVRDHGAFVHTSELPDGTRIAGTGAVSPSGDVVVLTDNDAADDLVGIEVAVKKSAGMSNASLSGDYVSIGYHSDTAGANAGAGVLALNFDGAGNGTLSYSGSVQEDFTAPFTYTVADDGTFEQSATLPDGSVLEGSGIVSPDGSVVAMVDRDAADGVIGIDIAIKTSSGMTDASFNGSYLTVGYHSDPSGIGAGAALADLTFDGAGNGTLVYMGSLPPPIPFTYSVAPDGTVQHSATLPDGTTSTGSGIVRGDGTVVAMVDNDPADGIVGMEVGVKASAGMSNASLSGDYVSVGYHGSPVAGSAGTALLELTFDGAGGGTVTYTGTAQEDFTTSLTYDVLDSGVFSHASVLPDGTRIAGTGAVSASGDVLILTDNDPADDLVGIEVAVKKSSGMGNGSLRGKYVSVGFHSGPDGSQAGAGVLELNFLGDGNGILSYSGSARGDFTASFTYAVAGDGTFRQTTTLPDGSILAGSGIVSPDGSVVAMVDRDAADGVVGIDIAIKKSQ